MLRLAAALLMLHYNRGTCCVQESDFQGFQANQVLYNVEPEVSLDVFFSDDLRIVNSPIGHRATHSLAVARADFLSAGDAYELMHQVHQVGYIPFSTISLSEQHQKPV
jgi:hypothetical protein